MRPTRPFVRVDPTSRWRTLAPAKSVLDVADSARRAGVSFLARANGTWGRLELAHWLVSEYRPSVLVLRHEQAPPSASGRRAHPHSIADDGVGRGVEAARERVIQLALSALRSWKEAGFAREMIDCGLVVGVCDERGSLGYAPADRAELRLVDRVASLFVADFLTRPRDYESLVTCAGCGVPSFAWDRAHGPGCDEDAPPRSGMFRKHEQGVGVPEGVKLRIVGR